MQGPSAGSWTLGRDPGKLLPKAEEWGSWALVGGPIRPRSEATGLPEATCARSGHSKLRARSFLRSVPVRLSLLGRWLRRDARTYGVGAGPNRVQ